MRRRRYYEHRSSQQWLETAGKAGVALGFVAVVAAFAAAAHKANPVKEYEHTFGSPDGCLKTSAYADAADPTVKLSHQPNMPQRLTVTPADTAPQPHTPIRFDVFYSNHGPMLLSADEYTDSVLNDAQCSPTGQ